MSKRHVDVAVISDVHLGTPACRAVELLAYLKGIKPAVLVLNGDIVDLWEVRRGFWPETHVKVLRRILKLAVSGVPVWYVCGNHDEALRRYAGFALGALHLVDRLELELGGRRVGFIHGDQCDHLRIRHRFLSAVGDLIYDCAMPLLRLANRLLGWCGIRRLSVARLVTRDNRIAAAFVERFERACADHGASRGYDQVVCGHIHQPCIRDILTGGRTVTYLNAGDWVDSMSALEFEDGAWRLVRYAELTGQAIDQAVTETAAVEPGEEEAA